MFNLTLDDFKDGKFAVQCKTEKSAVDFFEMIKQTDVDYHGLVFPLWGVFEEESCYFINTYDELDIGHTDYCNYNKIPVIEFI